MQLSLEEQYDYLQEIRRGKKFALSPAAQAVAGKTHMSFSEMDEMVGGHLDDLDDFQRFHASSHLSRRSDTREKVKLQMFNEFVEDEYVKRFDAIYTGHKSCKEHYQSLQQRYVELKTELDASTWRVSQGVEGENRVYDLLKVFLHTGYLLQSVRVEYEGYSSESDLMYIGPTGVYTLEIKNFGEGSNWSIHIAKDGQWRKVFPNGTMQAMEDVGNQVSFHTGLKTRFLNEKLRELYGSEAPMIIVEGAVVIANDNVFIENDSDLEVHRPSSLVCYLEKGEAILSPEWQKRIVDVLKQHALEGKKYPLPDFFAQMENLLIATAFFRDLYSLRYGWIMEPSQLEDIVSEKVRTLSRYMLESDHEMRNNLWDDRLLSMLHRISGYIALFIFGVIMFFTYVIRLLFGFWRQQPLSDPTIFEDLCAVLFIILLIIYFSLHKTADLSKWFYDSVEVFEYRKLMKKEYEKIQWELENQSEMKSEG